MPDNAWQVRIVGRMALLSVILGVSLSAAATERVDAGLVLSTSLAWSFVPVLQLLTGLVLTRGTANRADALDAYFATHGPWSLWILGVHALYLLAGPARDAALWIALTAAVPAVWTARLLVRMCRERLGLSARESRARVLLHEAISYGLVLLYVQYSVALGARLG
jgi:hypothetical protein